MKNFCREFCRVIQTLIPPLMIYANCSGASILKSAREAVTIVLENRELKKKSICNVREAKPKFTRYDK